MSNLKGHPKGLYLIFTTATAERFSYYGMRAIFTLFLIKALLFDKELASTIYGNFTGLAYLTPLIGGYVADKYWGIRRSVFWGGIMMGIGQFLLFLSASMLETMSVAHILMYAGLGFLIFGSGFFKPTITTLVGQLYKPNDKRLDTAYTLFYMGVNVGAFFAPIVCGYFGDTDNPADFKWGFLIAAIGMIVSLTLFETLKNKLLLSPDGEQIGVTPDAKKTQPKEIQQDTPAPTAKASGKKIAFFGALTVVLFLLFWLVFDADIISAGIFSTCIGIPAFVIFDGSLTKIERERILVIYIIAFFVIFFWAAFEQAGVSLTYFAEEQTNRNVFGFEVRTSWLQSLNPLFVVLLAFVMPGFWAFLGKRNLEPASPGKQAVGLLLLSLGYLVIAFGVHGIEPGTKVNILWITSLYFIHTMGEMAVSPIGLSMVNKLTPLRFASLMMGIWYLSMATANNFAGILSGLYPEEGKEKAFLGFPIENLFDFFMLFVIMSGVAAVILFLLSKRLNKLMHGIR